jgi:hypothetical protein
MSRFDPEKVEGIVFAESSLIPGKATSNPVCDRFVNADTYRELYAHAEAMAKAIEARKEGRVLDAGYNLDRALAAYREGEE